MVEERIPWPKKREHKKEISFPEKKVATPVKITEEEKKIKRYIEKFCNRFDIVPTLVKIDKEKDSKKRKDILEVFFTLLENLKINEEMVMNFGRVIETINFIENLENKEKKLELLKLLVSNQKFEAYLLEGFEGAIQRGFENMLEPLLKNKNLNEKSFKSLEKMAIILGGMVIGIKEKDTRIELVLNFNKVLENNPLESTTVLALEEIVGMIGKERDEKIRFGLYNSILNIFSNKNFEEENLPELFDRVTKLLEENEYIKDKKVDFFVLLTGNNNFEFGMLKIFDEISEALLIKRISFPEEKLKKHQDSHTAKKDREYQNTSYLLRAFSDLVNNQDFGNALLEDALNVAKVVALGYQTEKGNFAFNAFVELMRVGFNRNIAKIVTELNKNNRLLYEIENTRLLGEIENTEDKINVAYAIDAFGKEAVKKLSKNQRITYYLRYSKEQIEEQIYQLDPAYTPKYTTIKSIKESMKRPTLLIILNKSDWNGAAYEKKEGYAYLGKYFKTVIYEAENEYETMMAIEKVGMSQKIHTMIWEGHSNEFGMYFREGYSEESKIGEEDRIQLRKISKYTAGSTLVLVGCYLAENYESTGSAIARDLKVKKLFATGGRSHLMGRGFLVLKDKIGNPEIVDVMFSSKKFIMNYDNKKEE